MTGCGVSHVGDGGSRTLFADSESVTTLSCWFGRGVGDPVVAAVHNECGCDGACAVVTDITPDTPLVVGSSVQSGEQMGSGVDVPL